MSRSTPRPFKVGDGPTGFEALLGLSGLSEHEWENRGERAAEKVGGGEGMRKRAFDTGERPLPGASYPPPRGLS